MNLHFFSGIILHYYKHSIALLQWSAIFKKYSMGKSELYIWYVAIHSCCIQKCLRHTQIHLQYGQFYMSYAPFHHCKFMCDIRYLINIAFSFICNVYWSIYIISISLCNMSESMYDSSINPFACFNLFIIWAKIALFVSIFVASSLPCCIGKIMHSCMRCEVGKKHYHLHVWPLYSLWWVLFSII